MVNVFVSSFSPRRSAEALPTLLLQRMCLEAVEVLAGAQWNLRLGDAKTPTREELPDSDELPSYRRSKSQRSHPVVLWAGADRANYVWLLEHMRALALEHVGRYYKRGSPKELPKPYADCYVWLSQHRSDIPTVFRRSTVKPSQLDYYGAFNEQVFRTCHPDIRVQYRLSLIHKWDYLYERAHGWDFRGPPVWYYNQWYVNTVRDLFGEPTTKTARIHRK